MQSLETREGESHTSKDTSVSSADGRNDGNSSRPIGEMVEKSEPQFQPITSAPLEKNLTTDSTIVPYTIFSRHQKWFIVTLITIAATFSGISANIYFPAIPIIANNLNVSQEAVTLTVTAYMIFQGISPSFWGALADAKGRRLTYMCTFLIYIGACAGLTETKHYYQLLILRCLQSTGSASTIAIGAGVLGDITTREERGGYMGTYNGGLLAPVAIGPILGGAFAGTLGWRAIFGFLTIFASSFLLILIFALPETLRSLVGNGSRKPKGIWADSPLGRIQRRCFLQQQKLDLEKQPNHDHLLSGTEQPSQSAKTQAKPSLNILSAIEILLTREVRLLILFLAMNYTAWQMTIASMSTLFKRTYGLDTIQLGLTFIGNGVGCMLGTYLAGRFLDQDYVRIKKRFERDHPDAKPSEFPIEYARLRTLPIYAVVEIASLLVFGWTIDHHVHISAPIIAVFFMGWSSTSIQNNINTLLVDVFPRKGASATAALNLARCLMGAGGSAAVLPLVGAIGAGWTFTLTPAILAAALGLLVVQVRLGPKWRKARETEKGRGR